MTCIPCSPAVFSLGAMANLAIESILVGRTPNVTSYGAFIENDGGFSGKYGLDDALLPVSASEPMLAAAPGGINALPITAVAERNPLLHSRHDQTVGAKEQTVEIAINFARQFTDLGTYRHGLSDGLRPPRRDADVSRDDLLIRLQNSGTDGVTGSTARHYPAMQAEAEDLKTIAPGSRFQPQKCRTLRQN